MRYSIAVALAACLLVVSAFAQVPSLASALTPRQVQEAIDWGTGKIKINGKKLEGNQHFQITEYGVYSGAFLLTPFLRVAVAAQEAKTNYAPFGPAEAAALLTDSLCYVVAYPYDRGPGRASELERYASVERMLIMPRNSDDASKAIQPVWTKPYTNTLKNQLGLTMETVTLTAAFPCEAVTPANDVIYILNRGDITARRDLRYPIKEKEFLKWR